MKSFLLQLIAALALLTLLTGCIPAAEAPVPAAEPDSREEPGDTGGERAPQAFTLAYEPAAGLNPYHCMSQSNRTVLSLLYEPLFSVDAAFQAAPYLCESYTASGDGRTHTLTLRSDVTFSDGSPLTAADAVASIQAARDSAYYGQRLRHVRSVTADSDRTVTLVTDAACGTLDLLLNLYVVKAATVQDAIPAGTGPYRAEQDHLVRTDWWRGETPPVGEQTIRLKAAETAAGIRDDFEYGQISLVCADPNAGARITYHSDFELWNNNTTVMQYVGFNLQSPVFVYSSLRNAVTYAIDRDAIVSDTAGGFATAAVLPASPHSSVYDQKLADHYAYNPSAFEAALASSGVRDLSGGDGILDVFSDSGTQALTGTMLVCLSSEQRVAAAQAVVDTLNSLGFQLTLKALEYDAYVSALRSGNFDLYYGEVRLSPDFDLSPFFEEGGSLSYGGIADSAVALLCSQAMENAGNAYDLHQKVMERGLLCPVLFKTYAIYSARGRITNLTPCLDGVFTMPMASRP